jgi:hypothetical protein
MFVELHDRLKMGWSEAVVTACRSREYERSISGEYHVSTFRAGT